MTRLSTITSLLLVFTSIIQVATTTSRQPVVFVPGHGASQLEGRLNKTSRAHRICALQSDWFDIWLNIHLLAPIAFDCLSENMKLTYNYSNRTTANTQGVDLRVRNFGSVEGVEYLDQLKMPHTDYFATIIETLDKNNNYTRDVDMLGASYDFRKAPNELGEFMANLTALIEASKQPVTIVCHSMGCPNVLHLLNSASEQWRSSHVRRLVALAAPWFGSVKAISAMLLGDNLGIPLLNSAKLQALQATFPSLMYLFPRKPVYATDRVLVQTPSFNYTLDNLEQLFLDTDLLDQREMWLDGKQIAGQLSAPGVELWCLHGSGIQTPSKIVYQDDSGQKYHIEHGDGDGTVNLESLEACQQFASQQSQPVHYVKLAGVSHINILRGSEAADFISKQILTNADSGRWRLNSRSSSHLFQANSL